MPEKPYTPEQIVWKLREAEVELAKGKPLPQVCEQLGVSEQRYYRWREDHVGIRANHAEKLRELESEIARLRKLVVDMASDSNILREAASGNM